MLYFYHIPSQPIIINSSSLFFGILFVTGLQIIICSSYGNLSSSFQFKSPIDRDKLGPPTIRSFDTLPPAFYILYFYLGNDGLWSYDRASAFLLELKTDLESPALAM